MFSSSVDNVFTKVTLGQQRWIMFLQRSRLVTVADNLLVILVSKVVSNSLCFSTAVQDLFTENEGPHPTGDPNITGRL
jgi:hypothetical protein